MLESTSVESLRGSDLRCVLFAGEVFPTAELHALRQLLPNARLVNLYGPTETNVCLWREVTADDLSEPFQPIPIGQPCPGITLWFDGDHPEEEKGELCVAGASVMKGYWRAQEHSALAFVNRESDSGEQMRGYLTGDLVSRDAAGVYRFLGRLDRQVKIRGFRVELGEIEATLREHPAVRRGVAVAPSDQKGIHRIEAFIRVGSDVADDERESTVRSISKYCVDRLPMHMVPTRIHVLDTFPATSNGKIDRRALTRRCERVDPS